VPLAAHPFSPHGAGGVDHRPQAKATLLERRSPQADVHIYGVEVVRALRLGVQQHLPDVRLAPHLGGIARYPLPKAQLQPVRVQSHLKACHLRKVYQRHLVTSLLHLS